VGATVDASFSSYMAKCWNVGSATDNYGAYYTHTTQLLYMMFLTGNMPNFWDMKPVPVAAETMRMVMQYMLILVNIINHNLYNRLDCTNIC
jgi:hypothetical protein